MLEFKHHAWRILTTCEKIAGLWPYQSKLKNFLIRCFGFAYMFSIAFGIIVRLIAELNNDMNIVIENVGGAIVIIGIIVKLLVPCAYENKRKTMYEQVFKDIETVTTDAEASVLETQYSWGLKFNVIYMITFVTACASFVIIPMLRMFVNQAFRIRHDNYINTTVFEKRLPVYVDYFVDEHGNYYFLLAHQFGVPIIGLFILFSHDLGWTMLVHHICALFLIVQIRLNEISKIIRDVHDGLLDRNVGEAMIRKVIASVVKLHCSAIEKVEVIEEIYNLSWLFVLVPSMFIFGAGLVILLLNIHNPLELTRYACVFIAILLHFFYVYYLGQRITDLSSNVFDACYECHWYYLSRKLSLPLRIMMLRSTKLCVLTGGNLFVLNMETYSNMLKNGFSYFNVFAATLD